jgi:hypothetical protein
VTNRFTQINVINYGFFQDVPDESGERMTERMTEQVTERMTERVTPNRRKKEKKELKNIKREVPTLDEIKQFVKEEKLTISPERFFRFYEGQDWRTSGGTLIRDWKAKAREWQSTERQPKTEVLPDYYNSEPIRDKERRLATPEEIERTRALLNKGRTTHEE